MTREIRDFGTTYFDQVNFFTIRIYFLT